MRIAIDLQGAQTESRFRGIGRSSLGLAQAMARNRGPHDLWIILSGALLAGAADIRRKFEGLLPEERICMFDVPTPNADAQPGNAWRKEAAERIREYFIDQLRPDVVFITSLFEGMEDDAAIAVGSLCARPTAVLLHDLIPLLNPAVYLLKEEHRRHYFRKIESLKRADLLLSISEYSRTEAIEALALPPERVVSISSAADERFAPTTPSSADRSALTKRFGITRKIVLCAPGGFDPRKNVEALVSAFGLLPREIRDAHQLVIASKTLDCERAALLRARDAAGLGADEVILTGYIGDDALIALYNLATLFAFPSLHEGFGLPVLEAMRCGAPVIGSNRTSIPEVIGNDEALFDPSSPESIAEKLGQALGDESFRLRLEEHGLRRASAFSWDASAIRAMRALQASFGASGASRGGPPSMTGARRPRMAFVSPLPPVRSGIANYSEELLPELARHYEIELIGDQPPSDLPPDLRAFPHHGARWLAENSHSFDRVLYQFGNSTVHAHMFGLLRRVPGVVVLHDFFLSGVLAQEELVGSMPLAFTYQLYRSHGYRAWQTLCQEGAAQARTTYPCNLSVLQDARAVVVHSELARTLARQWYGDRAAEQWTVIPHLRRPAREVHRAAARHALGISEGTFLVCSFGLTDPTKLSHRLLDAWSETPLARGQDARLVYVGANHGGGYGEALERAAGASGNVTITGWVDDDVFRRYLEAADLAVQLRSGSRGETSGAVLHCMNHGVPLILNGHGTMLELPADAAWRLPDTFSDEELAAALTALQRDPIRRQALAQAGRAHILRDHDPARCAARYVEAIERAYGNVGTDRRALFESIASMPGLPEDEAAMFEVSRAISASTLISPRARQLLVDVSAGIRGGTRAGAEVRALLGRPMVGWRVEPVYLSDAGGRWHYRYAREYTKALLKIDDRTWGDEPVEVRQGDACYCPEGGLGAARREARRVIEEEWRARGIRIGRSLEESVGGV